jgi:cell wall assembly regulator SMI1
MESLTKFDDWLELQRTRNLAGATHHDIMLFERNENVLLPEDLREYFLVFKGTANEYDEQWFCFYALKEFYSLDKKFADWQGVPNYRDILKSLDGHENCFVFADYQCHLFSYAIRLYQKKSAKNEVYAISGGEFKIIAESFGEFMEKYLNDVEALQF